MSRAKTYADKKPCTNICHKLPEKLNQKLPKLLQKFKKRFTFWIWSIVRVLGTFRELFLDQREPDRVVGGHRQVDEVEADVPTDQLLQSDVIAQDHVVLERRCFECQQLSLFELCHYSTGCTRTITRKVRWAEFPHKRIHGLAELKQKIWLIPAFLLSLMSVASLSLELSYILLGSSCTRCFLRTRIDDGIGWNLGSAKMQWHAPRELEFVG